MLLATCNARPRTRPARGRYAGPLASHPIRATHPPTHPPCSGPRSFPMLAVVRLEHIKHALLLGAVDTGATGRWTQAGPGSGGPRALAACSQPAAPSTGSCAAVLLNGVALLLSASAEECYPCHGCPAGLGGIIISGGHGVAKSGEGEQRSLKRMVSGWRTAASLPAWHSLPPSTPCHALLIWATLPCPAVPQCWPAAWWSCCPPSRWRPPPGATPTRTDQRSGRWEVLATS